MAEFTIEIPSVDDDEVVYCPDERHDPMPIEPLVRCKDCKYALMSICGEYAKYCKKLTTLDELEYPESEPQFDADFYCAYGERKVDA